MLRLSATAPGMAFGNGLIKLLGSNLFARLSGYPAIFLGFASDYKKSQRQKMHGNTAASDLTFYGGGAVAIGSVLVLEGGLAIAGATTLIPFAGWTAAAVVLLGAAIIAGGIYLHAKATEHLHTPIELWASRSIFGNRLNDGESRPDIILDTDKKLPTFVNIKDEINAWHQVFYSPSLLSKNETKLFDLGHLDSKWTDLNTWTTPNWTAITHNQVSSIPPLLSLQSSYGDFYWARANGKPALVANSRTVAYLYYQPHQTAMKLGVD
ncbi:hypothetical protein D3C80_1084250 [compost metagenome]